MKVGNFCVTPCRHKLLAAKKFQRKYRILKNNICNEYNGLRDSKLQICVVSVQSKLKVSLLVSDFQWCVPIVMFFSGYYFTSGGNSWKANRGIALVFHHVPLSKAISTTLALFYAFWLISITFLPKWPVATTTMLPLLCDCKCSYAYYRSMFSALHYNAQV